MIAYCCMTFYYFFLSFCSQLQPILPLISPPPSPCICHWQWSLSSAIVLCKLLNAILDFWFVLQFLSFYIFILNFNSINWSLSFPAHSLSWSLWWKFICWPFNIKIVKKYPREYSSINKHNRKYVIKGLIKLVCVGHLHLIMHHCIK